MIRDGVSRRVIGAAIEVHRALGPGLLESAYEECMCVELADHGLAFTRQVPIPVWYKGVAVERGYRVDLVVENSVVVEIKTVKTILPIHEAQLLTYLKLGGWGLGLLLNFNVSILKDGIRRRVL